MTKVAYPSGERDGWVECLALETLESLYTELETCRHKFTVWSFLQGVVDNCLVLVDCDGTCGVYNVSSGSARWRARVERTENELFLQVRKQLEVTFSLPSALRLLSMKKLTLLTFTLASFEMTPVPLHGASSSTLSNPPITLGNSRAS
jgi:hypothetical protein